MSYIESSLRVRRSIAKLTDTDADDWFLCMKARFGLAEVYRAIHDTLGAGAILTTPYTCITSINPILVADLTPSYLDIDPTTLSPSALPADTSQAHALVVQHTFGLIGDKSALISQARMQQLLIIEDSAHCLLRLARDSSETPLADISVHSFGVEKILHGTKFGGAIYLNPRLKIANPELHTRITQRLVKLPAPTTALSLRARIYRPTNSLIQHLPRGIKNSARQLAIKLHVLEPAIYPYEQEGRQAPSCAPSQFVNQRIYHQLAGLAENYEQRKANVATYQAQLRSEKFSQLYPTNSAEPLLAFPLKFNDAALADKAYELLTGAGFFIRRWYHPLLYPGTQYPQIYHYDATDCPTAESLSACVLGLPTDLTPEQTAKIISLLQPVEKPVQNSETLQNISPNA